MQVPNNSATDFLRAVPVHFILCTERTGSSMLTAMLNQSPLILSTSEQLFPLYFYKKYRNKVVWTQAEIDRFVEEFYFLFERNIKMFFSDLEVLRQSLYSERERLDYQLLIRVVYFHFLDLKDKSAVTHIIDKQIAFLYYPERLKEVFPESKILILTRDVRDNIVSRKKRKFNKSGNYFYLAGIWNDTYRNVGKVKKLYGDDCEVLHYEALVTDPVSSLNRVCEFFNVKYTDEMLQFHETFDIFLKAKKEQVGENFIQWVRNMHGSMLKPVFSDKIGNWKTEMTKHEAAMISGLCLETGKELGYDFSHPFKPLRPGFSARINIFLARVKRYYLLRFYMWLPLSVKLGIKKIKGKKF
jgi:hypothetical protein